MVKSGKWGAGEITKLVELYSSTTNRDLSKMFGRSQSAIRTKAYKLGLVKSEDAISRAISERYDDGLKAFNKLSINEVPLNLAFKHCEWLRVKYYDEELSLSDIAGITGSTRKNIEYWMNKFNLPRRDSEERYTDRNLAKISETGKGRVPFSKGLTKHDHPSIMKISEKVSGENAHNWQGGRVINSNGYMFVMRKEHPKADRDGYVLEHRLVMEITLGRILESHEIVHHRDRNRLNNEPSNLYLFPSNRSHLAFHNYQINRNAEITEEQFMEEVYAYG